MSFTRSDESFRFLVEALRWNGSFDQSRSGVQLLELAAGLGQAADVVSSELRVRGFERATPIPADDPCLVTSFLCALALGVEGAETEEPMQIKGSMVRPTPAVEADGGAQGLQTVQSRVRDGIRPPQEDRLFRGQQVGRDTVRDWLFRLVALRQSTSADDLGVVHGIDAARLISACRLWATFPGIPPVDAAVDPAPGVVTLQRLASHVHEQLPQKVEVERTVCRAWVGTVSKHIDLADPTGEVWWDQLKEAMRVMAATVGALDKDGTSPSGHVGDEVDETIKGIMRLYADAGPVELRRALESTAKLANPSKSADARGSVAEACSLLDVRYRLHPAVLGFVERSGVYLVAAQNSVKGLSKDQDDPIVSDFSSAFVGSLEKARAALEALERPPTSVIESP